MKRNFRKFTQVLDEYLKDEEFAAEFLSQSLEEGDFKTFLLSLKDIMRVHGSIQSIAKKCKISRSTLYNIFSEKANPEMKTILVLLGFLGYELKVLKKPKKSNRRSRMRGISVRKNFINR
jgi:probable addiction module antidote protein